MGGAFNHMTLAERGGASLHNPITLWEDHVSPRTRCPPGHVVLGLAVPPDAWS